MDSIKAQWNQLEDDEAIAVIAQYTHLALQDTTINIDRIGDQFNSPISLFAASQWFRPSLEKYRNSFSNLFVFSWQKLLAKPRDGIGMLLRNKEFMESFCKYVK